MTQRRILFGAFGSAGDLFPIVPLMRALLAEGHDVRCAATRSLGLYLRTCGIPAIALGDGSELRVVDDAGIFTTADGGWDSWRQTVDRYVLPTVEADVAALRSVTGAWRPDVAVTTSLALPVRLAMHLEEVPVVEVTIYPQHAIAERALAHTFDHPIVADVVARRPDLAPARAAWGVPSDVLLHDAVLLGDAAADAVGFPYWDEVPGIAADIEAMDRWAAGPARRLLVTLGSFIGVARRDAWYAAADAAAEHDLATAFVGARGSWAEAEFGSDERITCVGFVPLSRYASASEVVVHHGGLGTTFAALRAGRPALVVPQAFDQGDNAHLVEAAGLGLRARPDRITQQLADLLVDDDRRRRVAQAAAALVDPTHATATAAASILAAV